MLQQGVAYVGVVVDDVASCVQAFEQGLGLPRRDFEGQGGHPVPVLAVGEAAIAVFGRGHPLAGGAEETGVEVMALATDNLEAAAAHCAACGLPVTGHLNVGLGGAPMVSLDPAMTEGVRVLLTSPLDLPNPSGQVERIDHLGVASNDVDAAIEVFSVKLGYPVESRQTDAETLLAVESFTSDKYGIVQHARAPRIVGGLRVGFVTVGDFELEFLHEFGPQNEVEVNSGRPGTTKQDRGAIARFISRRGQGLHHVALKVDDIDAVLADLGRARYPLIDRKGRPGSRRGLIGFAHPRAFGGLLVHFVERDVV